MISSTRELRLDGLIPAAVLPMTADGAIDETGLRHYLRWIAGQQPAAVAVNADTGEGPGLTSAERLRVIEIAREEVALPIVAGLFDPADATRMLRAGADAALVFPVADHVVDYHRTIVDAGLEAIAFQLQRALGGVEYDRSTIEQVTSLDGVIAIKEASFDRLRCADMVNISAKPVLTGNDNFILESLELGCTGALIGFGAIRTADQVAMIDAWHRGDHAAARAASAVLQPLADAVFAPPVTQYRTRLKQILVADGVLRSDSTRAGATQ
jgi:4-hydroxy-tetrahydrodipicolinate synthase